MVRTIIQRSRGRTFWRSLVLMLVGEAVTILVMLLLLGVSTNRWAHARTEQAMRIAQAVASSTGWSLINRIPTGRDSTLGESYLTKINKISGKYFLRDEGAVYLAVVDRGEEYDILPGDVNPMDDEGKPDGSMLEAYSTGRATYTPVPVSNDTGTYLAAYVPILSGDKVLGLVAAEYDTAPLSDFQGVVRTALRFSIAPAIFIALILAYILASMFVEPMDVLRTIGENARLQVARSLRGEKDVLWDSLTPRELEVADLAGEGLQNKEIAERLFVSPETVKQHLKSVARKTGWTTRQLGLEAQARRIALLLRATT
jgi:DNA-binding CsgD family transcriptional regulator